MSAQCVADTRALHDRSGEVSDRVTLSVCMRCRLADWRGDDERRPGAELAKLIREKLSPSVSGELAAVRAIRCMSQCKRPCVVAFSGDNRFTWLFGDLNPVRDASAVLACFDLYRSKIDGFMERPERPEALRAGVLGRIPPLGSSHPIVRATSPIHSG